MEAAFMPTANLCPISLFLDPSGHCVGSSVAVFVVLLHAQVVDEIYDPAAAAVMGIEKKGQVGWEGSSFLPCMDWGTNLRGCC